MCRYVYLMTSTIMRLNFQTYPSPQHVLMIFCLLVVEENTESIDNPLHEACKRGNMDFMRECLGNKVCIMA